MTAPSATTALTPICANCPIRTCAEIAALARSVQPSDDGEINYVVGDHLAFCGQTERALQMVKHALDAGYCPTAAAETDVFFERVRRLPEFAEIRTAVLACRDRFVAATGR